IGGARPLPAGGPFGKNTVCAKKYLVRKARKRGAQMRRYANLPSLGPGHSRGSCVPREGRSSMRKSLLLIPVLAALAAVSACGNSSEKGRTLARIDGAAFTEGDLDLRLNVHEDARRKEILANPELRRAEFETFLHQLPYAQAGHASSYGKSKQLRRHHELQDQRVMTQYYFEVFLGQQGGRTRADIEAYYAAAPERFTDDSGRTLSFTHAFSRVVDSLL